MSGGPGEKIRFAVVGVGWISQDAFMPAVAQTGNSVMTALVTGDPKKAEALGRHYGIRHTYDYAGFGRMLDDGVADALYLATPNTLHRDFAVAALERGVHVLCEKPLAPTVEDCEAIIAAEKRGGAKLMVAYRLHFEEGNVAAIDLVRQGRIGEPRIFSSVFGQQVAASNHRLKPGLWAGPLPDLGTYPINAMRNLFGAEPLEVTATKAAKAEQRFAGVEEMVTAVLRFPEDRMAQFTVSYGVDPLDEYRVVGTKGNLLVSPAFQITVAMRHRLAIGGEVTETQYPAIDQFGGELRYFSDCILHDRAPEPDGAEGLADVRVLKAVEAAIESGRPVRLDPRPGRPGPTVDQIFRLPPVKAPPLVNAATPGEG
jgi:predicted dehydrogenase